MTWFDNTEIVDNLPSLYRWYASYCRVMPKMDGWRIPGGSFLFRRLLSCSKLLGLADYAVVTVNGLRVAVDLRDSRMFDVFWELDAKGKEFKILSNELAPGDTFLDVGANHGSFSLLARQIVGSEGTVLAFEPQPRLARLLRLSFQVNGYANCRVEEVALSDSVGVASFYVPSSGSGSASVYEEYQSHVKCNAVEVNVANFDGYVEWQRFTGRIVVKLDVEGSEHAFVAGAEKFLRERAPTILFELNATSAAAAGYSNQALIEQLVALGYTQFSEMDQYPDSIAADQIEYTVQRNLLAVGRMG